MRYLTEDDCEHRVTIVGTDEAITEKGQISLVSPVARALMRARVGDEIRLQTPVGEKYLEILEITYDAESE